MTHPSQPTSPAAPSSSAQDSGILAEPYRLAPITNAGTQEDLVGRLTKDARARLESTIGEIIAVEAPIELDALARKTGKCFGYQRVAKRWKRTITYRMPGGVLVQEGTRQFVWPEEMSPSTWRGYRESGGARTVAEIPTTELANAIVATLQDSRDGLTHTAVYRGTLNRFGLSRLTVSAAMFLQEALALAVVRGDLIDEGDEVRLAVATDELAPVDEEITEPATVPGVIPKPKDAAGETEAEKAAQDAVAGVTDADTEPLITETSPIRTKDGVVFKRWEIASGMSVAPLIGSNRRGIYVLEFNDGSRYVGLTENILNRFIQHTSDTSHHEAWMDVVALRFREMPTGNLRVAELLEINRQLGRGHHLRNKDGNFISVAPSLFDELVTIEEQKHWATGHGSYGLDEDQASAALDTRLAKAPEGSSKLRSHVGKKLTNELYEGILDDIAFCLTEIIPNALELEGKYWTISNWPSTAGGRFATLNVGSLELAFFPRAPRDHLGTFELEDLDFIGDELQLCYFNLPPAILTELKAADAISVEGSFRTNKSDLAARMGRTHYPMTPTTKLQLPAGQLRQFFNDVPELLLEARNFALDVMRYQDSRIFRRHHSESLTCEVLRHVQRTRADR